MSWREAPLSRALATAIAAIGLATGKVPRAVRRQLRYHSFRQFCVFNIEAIAEKCARFRSCLDRAGLAELVRERARVSGKDVSELSVAVKASFMLGYNERDRSPIVDPELLDSLAQYLAECGVGDVAVVEAPNLYDRFYRHRSVLEVARYLGIGSEQYRLIDAGDEQLPHSFVRGMGQATIAMTWQEADLRISFAKMRSHAIEMAYLTVANLESLGGRSDEYIFADRQADRDSALMTVMSDFPPHFALIDAYALAADGLMGIMGCPRPKSPMRFYAGRDAIAVDIVASRHMAVHDPCAFRSSARLATGSAIRPPTSSSRATTLLSRIGAAPTPARCRRCSVSLPRQSTSSAVAAALCSCPTSTKRPFRRFSARASFCGSRGEQARLSCG